jgi:hypothetical protein
MRNYNKNITNLIKYSNCLSSFEIKNTKIKRMTTNNLNKNKQKIEEHKVDIKYLKKNLETDETTKQIAYIKRSGNLQISGLT